MSAIFMGLSKAFDTKNNGLGSVRPPIAEVFHQL